MIHFEGAELCDLQCLGFHKRAVGGFVLLHHALHVGGGAGGLFLRQEVLCVVDVGVVRGFAITMRCFVILLICRSGRCGCIAPTAGRADGGGHGHVIVIFTTTTALLLLLLLSSSSSCGCGLLLLTGSFTARCRC